MNAKEYIQFLYKDKQNFSREEVIDLVERFSKQKCYEQRKSCGRNAWSIQYEFDPLKFNMEYEEVVISAPEPEI